MTYSIDSAIFSRYPTFFRVVIFAHGIDNSPHTINELETDLRKRISSIEIAPDISIEHPRIKAWTELYQTFSQLNKRKPISSIGNLVKRIRSGGGSKIPFISPMVCISNTLSLTHLVPSGVIDIDKVGSNVLLGYALGGERFRPLGSESDETIDAGEIIYFDQDSRVVLCRAFNSKGGRDTLISPQTTRILLDLDGLSSVVDRSELLSAAESSAKLIERVCGGKAHVFLLDENHPVHKV